MPGQAVVTIRDKRWNVAVANTFVELTTGLSEVTSLPPQTGVLFDLGYDQKYIEINMSQMLFPLDIIFINSTQGVVGVLHNVQPGLNATLQNERYPGARCFLEVNAGEAQGVEAGDSVAIEGYAQPTQFDMGNLINIMVAAMLIAWMMKLTDRVLAPPQKRSELYGSRGEKLLPQTSQLPPREIVYTVNLEAPRHVEEIVLEDTKAVLKRYGKAVVTFRPTDTQRRKIQQGKGHIHIFADQIEETIRPWRVREALYWPQTGGIAPEGEMGEVIEESSAPADKKGKTLAVFMEVAEWYVKHRQPMTVKELRPIAARYFKTEQELVQFYEYLVSPEGQKEFRRELRAAMRRHNIPLPPEEEWLPLTMETEARFKPGEIVNYQGERVRVQEQIGDRVNIFIPSRQELVWVKPEKLEKIGRGERQPAVIPTEPRPVRPKPDELEFLPDSPEFLAYTIDDIGYREKLDTAFEEAITRAKRLKQW